MTDSFPSMTQDEGVLHDVLEQLDRERKKRAQLDAEVRQLTEQVQKQHDTVSRKEYLAMKSQMEGFQELVDALTTGKPAIAAAAVASSSGDSSSSLDLHTIRLLEIMPWRARDYVAVDDKIVEWNYSRNGQWQSHLRHFPANFKSIPVLDNNSNKSESSLAILLSDTEIHSTRAKQGLVLTNEEQTQLYRAETSFPLPNDGAVWEWIGAWRVQPETVMDNPQNAGSPTDADGWVYVADDKATDTSNTVTKPLRHRTWSRRRVLIDYPLASEQTREYLKVVCEKEQLAWKADQIRLQLEETKVVLAEEKEKNTAVDTVFDSFETDEMKFGILSKNNEQVKEFGSKLSHWVQSAARKTSEDLTSVESLEDDTQIPTLPTEGFSPKFPWKKLGRGGLIEKLARPSSSKRVGGTTPATQKEGAEGLALGNASAGITLSESPLVEEEEGKATNGRASLTV